MVAAETLSVWMLSWDLGTNVLLWVLLVRHMRIVGVRMRVWSLMVMAVVRVGGVPVIASCVLGFGGVEIGMGWRVSKMAGWALDGVGMGMPEVVVVVALVAFWVSVLPLLPVERMLGHVGSQAR